MGIQFVKLTFPLKPWPRENAVQYFGLLMVLKDKSCFSLGFVLHAVNENYLHINWWTIDDHFPDNFMAACLSKCIFNRRGYCWSCLLRMLRQTWVIFDRFALFTKHFSSYDVQLRVYTCKPSVRVTLSISFEECKHVLSLSKFVTLKRGWNVKRVSTFARFKSNAVFEHF